MRFTVVWNPTALDQLAEIWLSSNNRDAIALDTSAIDRTLANDPQMKGRPMDADRLLILTALSVTFHVSEDDRLVRVLHVLARSQASG